MMNKKTLLDQGLLEQYLLGELDAATCQQIEQLLASDAELKAHFDALEQDFETLGLENAVAPPPSVKTKLLQDISNTKVVKLKPNNTSKWYLGIAASVTLLLMLGSFWLYNELNDVKQQLQTVETNNTELNTTIKTLNQELETNKALYAAIVHPDTEQYSLHIAG